MILEGRVVLMTGGGRGLGRAMAEAVLVAGGRVLITGARSMQELESFEKWAMQRFGTGRLAAVLADVSRPEQCRTAVDRALDTFGALHVLVNNAGRGMREISETFNTVAPRFWEAEAQAWFRIVDTNVNGAFYMAHAAVPKMLAQGFGRIINISTSLATMQRKGYSPYGPSKAALESMTTIWAQDLAGTGVTVNSLLPGGAADTDLLPGIPGQRRGADGNMLAPTIMGPPLVWLASDQSASMNGQRLIAKDWTAPVSLIETSVK